MCFHSSGFDARTTQSGELILYHEQDTNLWNIELISWGEYYLNKASTGNTLTKYHVEAAIAYWHTHKDDSTEKWESILQLYNKLLFIEYSPIAALNRTFALAKANSFEEAISEAEKLNLKDNQFYYALLGELYTQSNPDLAKKHFESAILLAKSKADKQILQSRLDGLNKNSTLEYCKTQ